MLQAHSFVWHYLWVAPNLLLLVLGSLMWRRRLTLHFPNFLTFVLFSAAGHLALYAADVMPSVTAVNFWRTYWGSLLLDAILKVTLMGEIFSHLSRSYPFVAKLGRSLIRGIAVVLFFAAVAAAAYAQQDNFHWLISGVHLFEQATYLVESGLLLSIFLFVAYFHLSWNHRAFGIALGLSISACVHLATWAVMANARISVHQRTVLDFLNMATYHICVLVWFYYLLIPQKSAAKSAVSLPEHDLDIWNRELERLLQQ
ncbi:MAG: hypothetical protein WB562_00140 [Candidatus Sulfotelmatobacter sp.]